MLNWIAPHHRKAMDTKTNFLEMIHISKTFPGITALENVSFFCQKGEIHALIGENGAGKSTLMNILGGNQIPDSGTIRIAGVSVLIQNPRNAAESGISFVHQEVNLLSNLTVCENVFLSREIINRGIALNKVEMSRRIQAINERFGYALKPDQKVETLSSSERQIVEIVRALIVEPEIIILDEPTAALSETQAQHLFEILSILKENGVCIIYISHRLDEIKQIADRVTILKDGKNIGVFDAKTISKDQMISKMVGRTLDNIYPDRSDAIAEDIVLKVENLKLKKGADPVNLHLHAGEIVGIGGLNDQGQREIIQAIFGIEKFIEGGIWTMGKQMPSGNIKEHIQAGLGFLPDDRRGAGLVLHQSVRENSSLASLEKIRTAFGFIRRDKELKTVKKLSENIQIKTVSLETRVGTLSGGNQQKVMLMRWLMAEPKVLIIDEPTKGVDVGARMSIYQTLNQLTKSGVAILLLTSDMMELIGLSDRIYVFYEGKITAEYSRGNASEEEIMAAASGIYSGVVLHE